MNERERKRLVETKLALSTAIDELQKLREYDRTTQLWQTVKPSYKTLLKAMDEINGILFPDRKTNP